jgi:hypothetical protein
MSDVLLRSETLEGLLHSFEVNNFCTAGGNVGCFLLYSQSFNEYRQRPAVCRSDKNGRVYVISHGRLGGSTYKTFF